MIKWQQNLVQSSINFCVILLCERYSIVRYMELKESDLGGLLACTSA